MRPSTTCPFLCWWMVLPSLVLFVILQVVATTSAPSSSPAQQEQEDLPGSPTLSLPEAVYGSSENSSRSTRTTPRLPPVGSSQRSPISSPHARTEQESTSASRGILGAGGAPPNLPSLGVGPPSTSPRRASTSSQLQTPEEREHDPSSSATLQQEDGSVVLGHPPTEAATLQQEDASRRSKTCGPGRPLQQWLGGTSRRSFFGRFVGGRSAAPAFVSATQADVSVNEEDHQRAASSSHLLEPREAAASSDRSTSAPHLAAAPQESSTAQPQHPLTNLPVTPVPPTEPRGERGRRMHGGTREGAAPNVRERLTSRTRAAVEAVRAAASGPFLRGSSADRAANDLFIPESSSRGATNDRSPHRNDTIMPESAIQEGSASGDEQPLPVPSSSGAVVQATLEQPIVVEDGMVGGVAAGSSSSHDHERHDGSDHRVDEEVHPHSYGASGPSSGDRGPANLTVEESPQPETLPVPGFLRSVEDPAQPFFPPRPGEDDPAVFAAIDITPTSRQHDGMHVDPPSTSLQPAALAGIDITTARAESDNAAIAPPAMPQDHDGFCPRNGPPRRSGPPQQHKTTPARKDRSSRRDSIAAELSRFAVPAENSHLTLEDVALRRRMMLADSPETLRRLLKHARTNWSRANALQHLVSMLRDARRSPPGAGAPGAGDAGAGETWLYVCGPREETCYVQRRS